MINERPLTELDFYDLLERMIERIPWKTEEELLTYRELMRRVREINLFGYLSKQTIVKDGEHYVNR